MHIIHYGGWGQYWEWEDGGIDEVLSLLLQSAEWSLLSKVSPVIKRLYFLDSQRMFARSRRKAKQMCALK